MLRVGSRLALQGADAPHARFLLGEAYTAEQDHPARNLAAAVEHYLQALYLDAEHPDYGLRHADASSALHDTQQSGSAKAVYVAQGGAAARFGLADMPMAAAYRCVAALRFPEARFAVPELALYCAEVASVCAGSSYRLPGCSSRRFPYGSRDGSGRCEDQGMCRLIFDACTCSLLPLARC